MNRIFNINGEIVREDQPWFTPVSRGYRYGDGFFESMKRSAGLLMHSVLHFERIRKSALLLKLRLPDDFTREGMIERIDRTASQIGADHARVRCTFFRETNGFYTPEDSTCTVVMEIIKTETAGYEWQEQGLALGAYREMTKNGNYISTLKTTSALIYVMAGLYARENGFDECVIFNDQGRVAESVSSNIFIVSGEFVITPPLNEYCIDGVMRRVVMNLAAGYGYTVLEQPLSDVSLTSADEIFLTNATGGIRWVREFAGKQFRNTVSRLLGSKLNPSEA